MAGVDVGTAYLTVVPSAKGFAGKLQAEMGGGMAAAGTKAGDTASKSFGSRFKSGIATAAKAGALGLAAALAGGIAFAKGAISEARESQKVGALTTQVIKSTGGAAKVTADQVGDLATAISNKTGIDDETIQSGANMLLTFKNIRNEVGKGNDIFNQSTSILTDMSAAMGTDPKQAAIQLGKALNDPVKGITALSRVGVTFTAGQKKTIESLVKGGKTAQAQKIILKELSSEFGGAAAAQSTAGEKMSTAWGNFKESIGTALLPILDKVEGFITDKVIPAMSVFLPKAIATVSTAFSNMKDAFTFGSDWESHSPLESFAVGARAVYDVITGKVIPAIQNFISEFKNGEGAGGKFRDILTTVAKVVALVVTKGIALVGWLNEHRKVTLAAAAAVLALVAITKIHAAVMAVQAAGGIIKMIQSTKIVTAVTKTWTAVQWLMNAALTANPIGIVIAVIAALVVGLVIAYKKSETFRNIVKGAFDAIGAAARFMWNNVVAPVIRFLLDAFVKVTGFYATLLRGLSKVPGFGWAKGAADKLQNVANKAAGIKNGINDIPDHKDVNVNFHVNGAGKVKLANGVSVDVGQYRARATGGPVSAGTPYIVGEHEPELFVPKQAGTILNQRQMAGLGGGKTDLSDATLQRLAAILSNTRMVAQVSPSAFDSAMGWAGA